MFIHSFIHISLPSFFSSYLDAADIAGWVLRQRGPTSAAESPAQSALGRAAAAAPGQPQETMHGDAPYTQ